MDNTSGYTGLAKMKDTSNEPPLSLDKRPTHHGRTNIDHHLEKLEKPGVHSDWSDFKAVLVTMSRFVLAKSNIKRTAKKSH